LGLALLVSPLFALASAPDETIEWNPAWFPLAEGDIWVYRQTMLRDGQETQKLRLKTARVERGRVFRLVDVDGDDYLFSSDAQGLLLHGEVKSEAEAVAFDPPLAYVTPDLLRLRMARSTHQAEGRSLQASAQIAGVQPVDATAVGKAQPALVTRFEYQTSGNRTFSIENHFVRGVGAVRRTFKLATDAGRVLFESRHELLAARVGGAVCPPGGENAFAALLFRHAFEHREVFGPSFPGFSCRVRVFEGDSVQAEAALEVGADGRIAALQGKNLPRGAEEVIRSIVRHRRGASFEERNRSVVFRLSPAPSGRVGVAVEGDSMGSRYEVSDGVIRQVTRLDEGQRRFRIDVHDVQWTPRGHYLATRFDVTLLENDGTVSEKQGVVDVYEPLGEDWIPRRRTIRKGEIVQTFEFTDVRRK